MKWRHVGRLVSRLMNNTNTHIHSHRHTHATQSIQMIKWTFQVRGQFSANFHHIPTIKRAGIRITILKSCGYNFEILLLYKKRAIHSFNVYIGHFSSLSLLRTDYVVSCYFFSSYYYSNVTVFVRDRAYM